MSNENRFKDIIAKQMHINQDDIQLHHAFSEDLGCDELDELEIAFSINDEFDVDLNLGDWEAVQTVSEALELIEVAL